MGQRTLPGVLRFLRQLATEPVGAALTDRELLEKYATKRDESAFATLVERHGPMVWGVCRRMLHDAEDAEDAFQAAFLVLARRAGAVRWQNSVGGWLHAVASRVCWKARTTLQRASTRTEAIGQKESAVMPEADPMTSAARHELHAILDEELARLPEKYRAPLVLCYLEGWTNEEAAEQLGWTKGTVSGRISRARDLLRQRLARRGLAWSVAALAAALPAAAQATVPAPLLNTTLKAIAPSAATLASARAVALAEAVLRTLSANRLRAGIALILLVSLLGATLILLTLQREREAQDPPSPPAAVQEPDPNPMPDAGAAAFVQAEITLRLGRDGAPGELYKEITKTVTDKEALEQWLDFFPGMTRTTGTPTEARGKDRLTIRFLDTKGQEVTLHSNWFDWDEGTGEHKVQGNLMKFVGEYFGVQRLLDQGRLLDPWKLVAFEEGGKLRGVWGGELYITDKTFGLRVVSHAKEGIYAQARVDYHSPLDYSIDPDKSPKEFNLYRGFKVQPAERGIYALEGDTLKICLDKSGKTRPTEFKTQPGNNEQILLILQRHSPPTSLSEKKNGP